MFHFKQPTVDSFVLFQFHHVRTLKLFQAVSEIKQKNFVSADHDCERTNRPTTTEPATKAFKWKVCENAWMNRWKEHFEAVLNCPEPTATLATDDADGNMEVPINVNAFSENEVRTAIKQLKNGKAPGVDNTQVGTAKVGLCRLCSSTSYKYVQHGVASRRDPS